MKYVLKNNNFEVNGKQYLKDVGGYDGTNVDDSKDVATVISEIVSTIPEMISVTYDELVSLRNNRELIPGKQYRITDYVTTTSQENTISAGHQFDIIVTADNEYTLNEEARAIQNDNDGYFDSCNLQAWKIWYSLDNDINRFKWANTYECIYTSNCKPFVGYTSDVNDTFCFDDEIVAIARVLDDSSNGEFYETLDGGLNEVFTHFGYTDDIYGVKQLTLYCVGIEDGEYYGIEDAYHYKGIFTIDGEEYDAWARFVGDSSDNIKDGYSGSPSENKIIYTLTNRIVDGEIISEPFGKGVIYRMIDEWGNDCPYDFKNIMFKRGLYAEGGGIALEDGDEDFFAYCYTFSWEETQGNIMDASIFGNNGHLLNDDYQISGVYGNIMCTRMDYHDYVDDPKSTKQWLNNNVFISTYSYSGGIYYGCYSNTFGDNCYSNTFGSQCSENTFGKYCSSNIFGNDCSSNTFGDECFSNKFGNDCFLNTFGNSCTSNTFGNTCYYNTFCNYCSYNNFGDLCQHNTFGNDCCSNTFYYNSCKSNTFGNSCKSNNFGSSCSSNTFGNGCTSNTFGSSCSSNTFGNGCSSNTFGNNCNINTFCNSCSENEFGNYCTKNTFGNSCSENAFVNNCSNNTFGCDCTTNTFVGSCKYNTFGNTCYSNSFNGCTSNTFGNNCYSNTFDYNCYSNTFGDLCHTNTFGNNCAYNIFDGNYCYSNTFGNNCKYNTFGNYCYYIKFGTADNTKSYYKNIIFDNGNSYIMLNCTGTTSSLKYYQNVRIGLGVNNKSTYKVISDANVGQTYETLYRPTGSQTIDI